MMFQLQKEHQTITAVNQALVETLKSFESSYMCMRYMWICLFGLFTQIGLFGQEDYGDIVYEDFVYYDHIKSITFTHGNLDATIPIIDLNRSGSLSLSFDDLEGSDKLYTYRLVHCDRFWNPSELDEFDYIDGFNGEEIEDYSYSSGTVHDYTNYRLELPNDDITWIISGNYLLIIYEGDNETGVPVITRRFMVNESLASTGIVIKSPLQVTNLRTHQKLDISLIPTDIRLKNPLLELEAVVLQNGRWDNAIYNINPQFQAGNTIQWDRTSEICMPALKEFRTFDFRSLKYTANFVHSIDLEDDETNVLLDLSTPRVGINFNSRVDLNGNFILDNEDRPKPEISSEYANVIFTLQVSYPYDEDVYVIGKFSDWKAKSQYKMVYDSERQLYYLDALFKQGYYNYMYATVDKSVIDSGKIEGNWYETENSYTVLVYLSEYGSLYDRLISVGTANSANR